MIYLDHAATSPLSAEAYAAMEPCLRPGSNALFGNANSLHGPGRDAFTALEGARVGVMRAIGAGRPDEVVFTSGATESDNAAIVGMAHGILDARKLSGRAPDHPTIIISAIEHDAVRHTCAMLKRKRFRIVELPVDSSGHVSVESLKTALTPDVLLVSIMAANNEVGSVQPIAELAKTAHDAGAYFHTDAVQALGKIPVDVAGWGVDAASFSAHKAGGPKGVGVLYLKTRTPFSPQMNGGGQERGLRSGTQNVAGALGCAAAFEHAVRVQPEVAERLSLLRDRLYGRLSAIPGVIPSVEVPRGSSAFLPNIVNVCVRGFESETLILQLDLKGFCVSGGSACSSHSLDPSHVLSALNIKRNLAQGSLRISMGESTTEQEIDSFLEAFEEMVS